MASAVETFESPAWAAKSENRVPDWVRGLFTNPLSITGVILVTCFALVALLAPVIAPPDNPANPFLIPRDGYFADPAPPAPEHPFGSTEGQYDIFYGVVWGTRTAFMVGIFITGITVLIGLVIGTLSGYYGGLVDEALQRVVDIFLAFPFLLAAITMAVVLQPRLHNGVLTGMIALIAFGWMGYARLIRGDVLSIKERDFVLAARAVGVRDWRMLTRHILPNSVYSLLVVASLDIGAYVLSFAALSFLGLGAEIGYADWGQMLSFARNWIPNLSRYWWIIVFPGMALVLYTLGWNLIGDAFRDALDPKMRGTRAA